VGIRHGPRRKASRTKAGVANPDNDYYYQSSAEDQRNTAEGTTGETGTHSMQVELDSDFRVGLQFFRAWRLGAAQR
jgi:hypothetical protein